MKTPRFLIALGLASITADMLEARPAPAGATAKVAVSTTAVSRGERRSAGANAIQVRAWIDGSVYRVSAMPGRVSLIALEPGEGLVAVAAGDTARWVIGDTTSGSGAARRTHVLVKPSSAGLKTNLVITTDRRVYLLDLVSGDGSEQAGISFTYPAGELLAFQRRQEALGTVADELAIERLNFNYAIDGDRPSWRPIRAFDDGRQVFIEFPPDLAAGEAPPLFGIGAAGKAELLNYRLRGRYYVVDRLAPVLELRLGEKRQLIVRIVRLDGRRPRRSRSW